MLRVEDLTVKIAGIEILRGISLEIERGKIVGLVGRNGAGKTSTMKAIMGIYTPLRGRVLIDGKDLTYARPHVKARSGIGYVPEDMRVYPWLTVRENIELALYLSGNLDKAAEIMDTIYTVFPEIRGLMERKGYYLSGGEKRMVAISRALALSPRFLLLDEAFEGLAPIVVDRFRKAVSTIRDLGIGVLIAESNFSLASKVVEYLFVIERGEIIFKGQPAEALERREVMEVIRGG